MFSGKKDGTEKLWIALIGSIIVIVFSFIIGLLSWLRYTYRFEDDELRIEYGIFVRKKRYIPFDRIQSIDLSEGVLQRVFGLVKVQIETAGGGGSDEAEAVLSAISKEEARVIQEYVSAAKRTGIKEDEIEQESQPIYKISTNQLLILSLTSGGVGVVVSAVFALLSQVDDVIPYKRIFGSGVEKWAVHNLIMIGIFVFIGFFIAWIVALIMNTMKYANFTVVKTERDIVISQGLLERRQITIPIKRIQAIRISENIIRQILGYGAVYVESAGGSSSNQEGANVTLLPIVKVKQVRSILASYLPEYSFPVLFMPVPKRAMWRYIIRSWCFVVPFVIIALIFLKVWGLLSLLLLALVTVKAVLKYKAAGWSLDQQQLSLRFRTNKRTTVLMKKNRIQSLEMKESHFQRKRELGTLEANVKSGLGGAGGTVVDMESSDLHEVYDWYSRKKKKRDAAEC
jgi:putative membrane protein